MKIFSIETSCDETSAAIVGVSRGKVEILSNVVSSQIEIHKKYGGVVPEVAARHHVKNILPVIDEAFAKAKVKPAQIDFISVTAGPGLITSLMVGVETAKTLSYVWRKPLLAVNHMYAHIAANFIEPIKFPALALIVSGGHTELILLKSHQRFEKIGQTIDDAAGEAFDKVAKLLDLGYPGGPIVSAQAEKFQESGLESDLELPRPMVTSPNFNFSFSGLKTAVLYKVNKMKPAEKKKRTPEICFEFQEAVVDVLSKKTAKAAKKFGAKTIMLAGGVAANKALRQRMGKVADDLEINFLTPPFSLCTDNAGMIAVASHFLLQKKKPQLNGWKKIKANPNWEL